MTLKQILKEGVVAIEDYHNDDLKNNIKFGRIETDIERHEDIINSFLNSLRKNSGLQSVWENTLKQYYNHLTNDLIDLGDKKDIREIFDEMDGDFEVAFGYISKYIDMVGIELGVKLEFHSVYNLQKKTFIHYNGIYNGMYVHAPGDQESFLSIQINSLPFLNILFETNDIKKFMQQYLQTTNHELTHMAQDIKLVNKKMSLSHINKLHNNDNIKSMERYIGTPQELPAWGKSIASYYYYNSDRDVKRAIEQLKGLNHYDGGYLEEQIIDYLRKQVSHGNNKVKMIVKYAYLYLKRSEKKDLEVDDINIRDISK